MSDFNISEYLVTNQLHEKTINIRGKDHTVYMRRLPAVDVRKAAFELMADDMDVKKKAGFHEMARAFRDSAGGSVITFDQLCKSPPDVINVLQSTFFSFQSEAPPEELGND